jgi:hypothetical protein
MFQDLTQQVYEAHLIGPPKLVDLAKFSLSIFEIWVQQKAAKERYAKQQLGSQSAQR